MKRDIATAIVFFLASCFLLVVAGCSSDGSGNSAATTANQATGSLVVTLNWGTSAKTVAKKVASAPVGVTTIRIIISAPDMTLAIQKDFTASAGTGTIDGVPVGTGRVLTAQGLDATGTITYQGTSSNITVQAGQTTDAGTIAMVATHTATDIPLTVRSHMDNATQTAYDRIRARQAWLLGVDALGSASNAFVTVPTAQVQTRWTELYGANIGLPACIEWEMAERNSSSSKRDWISLKTFAEAGGLPWIMVSMNNFTVPFVRSTPPQGGMNDTRNHAAGVLPGGSGSEAFVAYIRQLAVEIKAVGRPVVFRPFHEGNGGWFWWGGNSDDFKALWTLAFQIFQEERVTNVIWLWAVSDLCSSTACNVTSFYPGDSMVDMLGVDLYFNAATLTDRANYTLRPLESIGLDKPIVIGELGPVARADFWSQAANNFSGIKRFRGLSIWFARGWNIWGGDPAVGSLIDGSTDEATRNAFSDFLADPRILILSDWNSN